jgi:hypothetical protein
MRLTERSRRRLVASLMVCAGVAVACIDMSAPKGAASISPVQLPSPFVVRGDTMRDADGKVAPVTVTSFDAQGAPLPIPSELFVLDTFQRAHFTVSHLLIGDRLGNVTVLGQASGVQTPTVNVPVTVRPTTLLLDVKPDTLRAPLGADSATSVGRSTPPLSTIVKGAGDTTVQGVIVRYAITSTLPSSSSTVPSVYIADGTGKPMSADTTDASGKANKRYVTVLTRLLTGPVLQQPDSVVVEASASYKGAQLIGSPFKIVTPVKVVISIR